MNQKAYDVDVHLKPHGTLFTTLKAADARVAELAARQWAKQNGYTKIKRVVVRPAGEKVGPNGRSWG